MYEVKYYVAWDGSEFESREECMEYEAKQLKIIQSISEKYTFFDRADLEFVKPFMTSENLELL